MWPRDQYTVNMSGKHDPNMGGKIRAAIDTPWSLHTDRRRPATVPIRYQRERARPQARPYRPSAPPLSLPLPTLFSQIVL